MEKILWKGRLMLRDYNIPECDREDLLSFTLSKFISKEDEVKNKRSYFISALLNNTKNYYRRNEIERNIFINFELVSNTATDEENPESLYLKSEFLSNCEEIIDSVSNPVHKIVLEKYFLDGWEFNEIAKRYKVKRGNVRQIVSRFKPFLKEKYEEMQCGSSI